MKRSNPLRHALVMLLLAGTAIAGDAMATTYRAVLLPMPANLPGGTQGAMALDINASGEIVGQYYYTDSSGLGGTYAVAWSPPDYAVRALPQSTDGVTAYNASRVNDDGIILGKITSGAAVMWTTAGPFVYLAPPDPFYTQARDLNALGIAVGQIGTQGQVALWTDPSTYTILNIPIAATANAINDSAEMIVGVASFFRRHAFRITLDDGNTLDLGDLPGGKNNSAANDVNNSGQIAGFGYAESGQRAVLWDTDGTIHDLGNIPGSPVKEYYATRINNVGEVIGTAPMRTSPDNANAYWLWTAATGMQSLNSLIDPHDPLYRAGTFTARGINDTGMLVGGFYPRRKGQVPVLLIPQP